MATDTPTTAPSAAKAPFWSASFYGLQFISLLDAWGEHITAQRILEWTDPADPGYERAAAWAEMALPSFHQTLLNALEAAPKEPLDLPLRRMTLLVATLVREDRGSAFIRYEALKSEFAPFFVVTGGGPAADEVRAMLASAERRLTLMSRLSCYRTESAACEAELLAA
ncbi:MAG: hypothetical protein ACU0HS_17660 [Paracoccus sp. (in: a-proteobacteria)]|uniref:hypothetical protein n=1 Tax=Paracoccus sp. TaxID=267 RepID=UPI002E897640|nr:hypothetical protein [Pseudomonadota bacterium]